MAWRSVVHLATPIFIVLFTFAMNFGISNSQEEENIALNKPTAQSSTYDMNKAKSSNAVKGNTDGNYYSDSCSHTKLQDKENPSFWWVYLKNEYPVGEIRFRNRKDCCRGQLSKLNIYLSSDYPVTGQPHKGAIKCRSTGQLKAPYPDQLSISCDGKKGRFVSVVKDGAGHVVLCGVQIFKERENIALHKPTAQSSTYEENKTIASNAVDGNTDGDWSHGSCSHTKLQDKGTPIFWWVDLKIEYPVDGIWLWNRNDCCEDNLNNLNVYLSSDYPVTGKPQSGAIKCGSTGQLKAPYPDYFPISCGGKKGRFVSIVKDGDGYIALSEVQVFKTIGTGTNQTKHEL